MSRTVRYPESIASALPINARLSRASPGEVLLLGQHLGLEGLQPGGQSRASIPDLFRTDQPEGRVLGEPLGVVEVFVTSQATVDGLPQQVGEAETAYSSHGGVGQMLRDQFAEPESLVEFAHQDQAAVGSDARTLEIDLERGVEGELKGLVLYLTHWVLTSGASSSRSHPHKY